MGKPKPEKPWICSQTRSATVAETPRSAAPARKRWWCSAIAASERLRLIARRSPSASEEEKPASAIATSITCSWKTIVPRVSRSTGSSSGCS